MARAPFQVIILPFLQTDGEAPLYAIFHRRQQAVWQAVSGGGEDLETPAQAAARETLEETGFVAGDGLFPLDSRASIPSAVFADIAHRPKHVFVVPEYAFGLRVTSTEIRLSSEHHEFAWLPFADAHERLTWDSNKVALWELEQRLQARPE